MSEKCPQVGDVIHCHCGKPSSHYGTMGYRGAREVREQPVALTSNTNYEDENRAFVADVAMRRGITLGHLRNDGGGELREIMRRLDEAIGNKPTGIETRAVVPETLVVWVAADYWRCSCKPPGDINHGNSWQCRDCGTIRPEKVPAQKASD